MQTRPVIWPLVGAALAFGLTGLPAIAQPSAPVIVPHPAWDCGMPAGIPRPESGELIFELSIPLDRAADIGQTQFGDRSIAVGREGSISGPRLSGKVMEGGLDYALTLANGTIEIEQILVLQAADGSYFYVRNAGVGPTADDVRIVMDFEAPTASDHAWLNSGQYVARRVLDSAAMTLELAVYDVSGVALDRAGAVAIEKPASVPAQSWDYREKAPAEQQGELLIRENVTLAPSQSVGASKRGNRNIIPITGGELSGQITGKVLMGGADYQKLTPPATIDARYLWQAARTPSRSTGGRCGSSRRRRPARRADGS
jgi:hypothetical protein